MWSLSHRNILLEVSRQPSVICDITPTTTVLRREGGVSDNIGLPTQACCPRGVFRRRIVNPWHAKHALLVSKPQFLAPKPQISWLKPQILNFKPQISRPETPKRARKSQTPIHSTEPSTHLFGTQTPKFVFETPNLVCETPKF